MPNPTKWQSVSLTMVSVVRDCMHRSRALPTDAELAAEYDRARGYDRPRKERAKEIYEAAADAPLVPWTPPVRRQHV